MWWSIVVMLAVLAGLCLVAALERRRDDWTRLAADAEHQDAALAAGSSTGMFGRFKPPTMFRRAERPPVWVAAKSTAAASLARITARLRT